MARHPIRPAAGIRGVGCSRLVLPAGPESAADLFLTWLLICFVSVTLFFNLRSFLKPRSDELASYGLGKAARADCGLSAMLIAVQVAAGPPGGLGLGIICTCCAAVGFPDLVTWILSPTK